MDTWAKPRWDQSIRQGKLLPFVGHPESSSNSRYQARPAVTNTGDVMTKAVKKAAPKKATKPVKAVKKAVPVKKAPAKKAKKK